MTTEQIEQFLAGTLLPYPVHGVLVVGSVARGYSTEESDLDLMAFYQTDGQLSSSSLYMARFEGVEITLEHHDLDNFEYEVLDQRYNLASLRMLLKVRDSVVVRADDRLQALIRFAGKAALDRTVLIHAMKQLVDDWGRITRAKDAYQRHLLMRYAELLLSLDVLVRPSSAAYSKPKWLYRNLRDLNLQSGIALLNHLYQPTPERTSHLAEELENLIASYTVESLPEDNRGFFKIHSNDCRVMLKYFPQDAFPPVRFLATAYYRFFCGDDLESRLESGREFSNPAFGKIFELTTPQRYDSGTAIELFTAYTASLAEATCEHLETAWKTDTGSKRFVPYLLSVYSALDLMPYAHKLYRLLPNEPPQGVEKWVSEVRAWVRQFPAARDSAAVEA